MTIAADGLENLTTTQPENLADPLTGISIIDCDSHMTEPPDLWTSRVPASLKSKVPVQRTVDGITAWDPRARLALLDSVGVFAQVLYPNGVGFSSNHIFAIDDLELRSTALRVYNDFYVDVQTESGGRLFPQALLPIWDMKFTVAEMTRLLDLGIRGFTLSDKPELLGLPELHDPYFEPMWDLFNSSGAVANFHIGAGRTRAETEEARGRYVRNGQSDLPVPAPPPPSATAARVEQRTWNCFGNQRRLATSSSQLFMSNIRIVANLCMSNLFDRFPNLKIVSAESGIGWVPFILETLEYQYDEMITTESERNYAKRRPREYFRDHIYAMFWFERSAPRRLIEDIGAENILVETDIPHPTCLYPDVKGHFARVLADTTPYARRRILQDNAAELYRIDTNTAR